MSRSCSLCSLQGHFPHCPKTKNIHHIAHSEEKKCTRHHCHIEPGKAKHAHYFKRLVLAIIQVYLSLPFIWWRHSEHIGPQKRPGPPKGNEVASLHMKKHSSSTTATSRTPVRAVVSITLDPTSVMAATRCAHPRRCQIGENSLTLQQVPLRPRAKWLHLNVSLHQVDTAPKHGLGFELCGRPTRRESNIGKKRKEEKKKSKHCIKLCAHFTKPLIWFSCRQFCVS